MNNLYCRLPVPDNFFGRVHIPHNYDFYPVPFLPMNLQTSQTNIQPNRHVRQESSSPSADMEPKWETWKHWRMLPSKMLIKIEISNLALCSSRFPREWSVSFTMEVKSMDLTATSLIAQCTINLSNKNRLNFYMRNNQQGCYCRKEGKKR